MAYSPGLDAVRKALSGQIDNSETDWIKSCADGKGCISPQHAADILHITRADAKSRLQAAANRGRVRALPNGWYEILDWNLHQADRRDA